MNLRPDALTDFLSQLEASLAEGRFVKATLAKYRGPERDLQRVQVRCVMLRGEPQLQLLYRHATKDITKNHPVAEAAGLLHPLLGPQAFRHAQLQCSDAQLELLVAERGQATLRRAALHGKAEPAPAAAAPEAHNREKARWLSLERPFLTALGVTTAQHTLVPSMSRKWKQINKFIEVFAHALDASPLAGTKRLQIVDFGSGKGYLTFAIHDWLRQQRGVDAQVTGVELRPDMVALCNGVIERLQLEGLRIEQGDVRSWTPQALNVMIALHACDTATDYAIDLGLRGGADIILCSPCCHKQIRPQLLQPHPLRPILQHGVHLGQEAEMLTDSLRALLLEASGYDTRVFEFVSLEHTNKNKMILAVKRAQPKPAEPVLQQIAEVKAFYGIREQCLEQLIAQRLAAAPAAAAG
ncbi:class I SAM-dependent methyltransferase [Aquabacterium sp.]|uniref:class I SAM-dependent methyltransferase n=1 Tax=Aquabacterium sp. TaxID=1872578 RepID=UPI0037849811